MIAPPPEEKIPDALSGPHSLAVLHVAAELSPFARTGGLAEAVASLAAAQTAAGITALAVIPLHRAVKAAVPRLEPAVPSFLVPLGPRVEPASLWRLPDRPGAPRVFFVDHPHFFDRPGIYGEGPDYGDNHLRFAFFALATLMALPTIAPAPLVLHAHDWHGAFLPIYLRTRFRADPYYDAIPSVLTVHNVAFQGHAPPAVLPGLGLPWEIYDWRRLEWFGRVNVLKGGLAFADAVTTVSERHAVELTTPEGGFGLEATFTALGPRLTGILSGIDPAAWDPGRDPAIAAPFSAADPAGKARCKADLQARLGLEARPDLPLVCSVGRLAEQKGHDLIAAALERILARGQLTVLGSGESRFERALSAAAARRPQRMAVETRFGDDWEHRILAGADLFLMPSLYEPCGLTQMRAMRYGTVPIGRRVGGIADSIEDGVNGFLFDAYHPDALVAGLDRALAARAEPERWAAMRLAAMSRDCGWERAVERYAEVYRQALAAAGG